MDWFKSPSKRFESLVKKEVKLRDTDSNHLHNDLNPSWKISEEIEAQIWIPYTSIRIPESRVMKNKSRRFESSSCGFESFFKLKLNAKGQTERFECSSYRFESLLGTKFKFYKGDSNPLHNDSNLPFYRSIKCATCNSNNPIFKSNLSHNG